MGRGYVGMAQEIERAQHAIHWRADLVTHLSHEAALGDVRRLGRISRLGQLGNQFAALVDPLFELHVGIQQLLSCPTQPLAGADQAYGRTLNFALQLVEAAGHLADFVARAHFDRNEHRIDRGRGEVAPGQRFHGLREIMQSARDKALCRAGNLDHRMGDHARKNEADRNREHGNGHENIFQSGNQCLVHSGQLIDGQLIARGIQHQNQHHRAGEGDVQGVLESGQPFSAAVGNFAPRIKRRARVGEAKADNHGGNAKLLETENRRYEPDQRRKQAHPDHAPASAKWALCMRRVPAQQPHGNAGHAYADQIGEVGSGNQPHRIANPQDQD